MGLGLVYHEFWCIIFDIISLNDQIEVILFFEVYDGFMSGSKSEVSHCFHYELYFRRRNLAVAQESLQPHTGKETYTTNSGVHFRGVPPNHLF